MGSIGLSTSTAGSYDITSTLSNSNYDITFDGVNKFSINSKPQINIVSYTSSYVYDGTTPIKPTATITSNSTTTGIVITGNIDKNVGTYILSYNATNSAGNKATPQTATVTITPKPITITANLATKVYGTTNPSFTYVLTGGLESGDKLAGTLGSSGINAGDYAITSTLSNNNYDIAFVSVNKFSISKKPVTITANTATRVYGTANPNLDDDRTNALELGDTLTGGLSVSVSTKTSIGSYDITSTLSNNNYVIAFVGVNKLIIIPKPVTITANLATKVYGTTANPVLDHDGATQILTGDSISIGTLGSSGLSTSTVGSYDITSTLSNNNYKINFVGVGKFLILKASQSAFSAGNDQIATIGTTFTIITTGSSSTSPVTYNTSNANIATIDASGVITIKAAGTVTIGATSTADNNYKDTYASFILTIYPTRTTLADATATISGVQLAWSEVVGSGISYKVYYATKTIIGHNNLATNYHNLAVSLIDNITNPATTVLNLKRNVVYHFVVTVVQNNVESVISNEVTSTLKNPLNDTGTTFAGNYPSGNNATCASSITAPQDCHQGRDAASSITLSKVGAGSAGFDFTKLDSNGDVLLASAASWSCVKDNVTGLIWEVKTTAAGDIHNKDNTYKWGGIGADSYGSDRYTDWNALVNGSNTNNLCGFNNWRVPNRKELRSIVDYSHTNPSIDTDYFPNTPASSYFWSSSVYASNSLGAWAIGFGGGDDSNGNSSIPIRVRLVRPGQ